MNKERNLLKLLQNDECLLASKDAFENADIHKITAETIALKGHYGNAVAHLILSTEEITKGILLYMQYINLNIRNISGMHLFFTDHIIKHQFAAMINIMFPFLELMINFGKKTIEKFQNPELDIKYTDDEILLLTRNKEALQNKFNDITEMLDWWDEANFQKNKGFYVDYSKSIETPMQVSEIEYKYAYSIASKFQTQILSVVSIIENASEEDIIEIKKNNKQFNMERLFLQLIESRKNEMKNKKKIIMTTNR